MAHRQRTEMVVDRMEKEVEGMLVEADRNLVSLMIKCS